MNVPDTSLGSKTVAGEQHPLPAAARKPLHVRALGPTEAAKKRLRLRNLEQRSGSDNSQLAALQRRTAKDAAQLDEFITRREASRLRSAPHTINQRRREYTAECETPVSRSSRLFAASVLATLALPLLIATAANFAGVPLHASSSKAHKRHHPVVAHIQAPTATQRPIYVAHKDIAARKDRIAAARPVGHEPVVAVITPPEPSPVEAATAAPTAAPSPLFQGPIWQTLYTSPPARVSVPATKIPAPAVRPHIMWLTARPLGPHLMSLNWAQHGSAVNGNGFILYRSAREGDRGQIIARLSSNRHSFRDKAVNASALYRYSIVTDSDAHSPSAGTTTVVTPPEMPAGMAATLAGKGMFLYFSSRLADAHSYSRLDPQTIMDAARNAGISFIELRMSRGAQAMADTPSARSWLDRLIDASAEADIRLLAWTVPRAVTAEDIAQSLAMARYRTAAGNGFVGLALDLESGDQYMGHGVAARNSMVAYIDAIRSAVGSHYLLVATVASPHTGHLTNDDVPYARIAAYADVMQPMEYWHYFNQGAGHEYGRREVALATAQAVLRTRELAGRDIPVNLAGQSVDLENTGSPSGREIMWSLGAAKSVGALGETFFDWAGTKPDAWAAIQAFEW